MLEGSLGLYKIFVLLQTNTRFADVFSPIIYNIGYLVSGVGLICLKGWGRNTALLFNGAYAFHGSILIAAFFLELDQGKTFLLKGIGHLLIASSIFLFLFAKNVRKFFKPSPGSWQILGLLLMLYSLNQDTGDRWTGSFWTIMVLVGLALTCHGTDKAKLTSFNFIKK